MKKLDAEVPGRHIAVVASASAVASLIPIALHQLGVVSHLPDPPFSIFASDLITQSKTAHPFGIPDSLLGIMSYTASLVLLVEAPRSPLFKQLARLKLWGDGILAAVNSVRQVMVFRKLCSWCLLTAAVTGVMIVAGRQSLR